MKPLYASTLALALCAWLIGCGPGAGGTGTGETTMALTSFGASTASVCVSSVAPTLACEPIDVVASPSVPALASRLTHFSDVAQGGNIAMAIQANSVELSERCRKLRFTGDWGITAANDAGFFGLYTVGTQGQALASLQVLPASGGGPNDLRMVMRDVDGRVLLGPVTLQRVAVPATPALACPP